MAEWQKIFIPCSLGLDESVHPKLQKLQVPLELENCYLRQYEALTKRQGFTRISHVYWNYAGGGTSPIASEGDIRYMFSTGEELCAVGSHRLFAYNEEQNQWYDRGRVSPFTGESIQVFHGERSWFATDMYTDGNYVLDAGRWTRVAGQLIWHGLQLRGRSLDEDSQTFPPTDFLSGVAEADDRPHAPKCAMVTSAGGAVELLCAVGFDGDYTPTQDAELNVYRWPTATPHLPPTLAYTIGGLKFDNYTAVSGIALGNTLQNRIYANRNYSIIPGPANDYFLAFIDRATDDIIIQRRLFDHSVANSVSLVTGNFTRVALMQDGSRLYVLAVDDTAAGTREVRAYTRDVTTLAGIVADVVLHVIPGANSGAADAEDVDHLGITTNGNTVLWTYSTTITNPSVAERCEQTQRFRTSNTSIGALSAEITIFNCLALADPFSQGTRYYLPAMIGPSFAAPNAQAGGSILWPAYGWAASVVLELDKDLKVERIDPEAPTVGGAVIVGIYHVGVAPNLSPSQNGLGVFDLPARNSFRRGCLNSVVKVGAKFHYQSERYTTTPVGGLPEVKSDPVLSGTAGDVNPRSGADFVSLDFGGKITATRLERGSAVIGGGAVFFYSGRECFELGFPIAPFLYQHDESGGVGNGYGINTTLSWRACWQYYDSNGFLHRGFPTPHMGQRTTPGAGGAFRYSIAVNTYPGTSKVVPYALLYVDDSANTGATALNPLGGFVNDLEDRKTETLTDDNVFKGAPLYTIGGRLENVSPEGSAFAFVALNRLMITSMYSRGRVHYSQQFTPGTAFEDALAPEMNEGLGKLFPDGERGVGGAELDGQAILFTPKSVYGLAGTGPNPTGTVGDFDLQLITGDGGCVNPKSIVECPLGVIYEGAGGIALLSRSLDVVNIGDVVQETLALFPTINQAVLWEKMRMVVFACVNTGGTEGRLLCFDYDSKQWFVWRVARTGTGSTGVVFTALAVHKDKLYLAEEGTGNGGLGLVLAWDLTTKMDDSTVLPEWITMKMSSSHIQLAQSGWQRCKELVFLMERQSPLSLVVNLYRDFSTTPFQTETLTDTDIQAFEDETLRMQLKVKPKIQKMQAFRFSVNDAHPGGTPAGQAAVWTGAMLQMAVKSGTTKVKKEQRR